LNSHFYSVPLKDLIDDARCNQKQKENLEHGNIVLETHETDERTNCNMLKKNHGGGEGVFEGVATPPTTEMQF